MSEGASTDITLDPSFDPLSWLYQSKLSLQLLGKSRTLKVEDEEEKKESKQGREKRRKQENSESKERRLDPANEDVAILPRCQNWRHWRLLGYHPALLRESSAGQVSPQGHE